MNQNIKLFEECKELYMSPEFEEVLRELSIKKTITRPLSILALLLFPVSLLLGIIGIFLWLGLLLFIFKKFFEPYSSYYEKNFQKIFNKATGVSVSFTSKKNMHKKQVQQTHLAEKANRIFTYPIGCFTHKNQGVTTSIYELTAYRRINFGKNSCIDKKIKKTTIMSIDGLNNLRTTDFRIFIKDNSNMFSYITENTFDNMIGQRKNEFKFNRIDLNKYFDGFSYRTKKSDNDLMLDTLDTITPAVENLLSYLRKKFGRYNISIHDNKIDIELIDMHKKTTKWKLYPYLFEYTDLKLSHFYRFYELIALQKLIIKFFGGGNEPEFISDEDILSLEEAISSNNLTKKEMDKQVKDYFDRVVMKRGH